MNRLLLLITTFFFTICNNQAQDFYDMDSIYSIHITFGASNWDALLDSLVAIGDDRLMAHTVLINGEVFDSVGVRFKGNSSYQANNAKNPLNIKLSYLKNQDYKGYQTFKLSSGFKDPSFAREMYAYEIARNYMPAPKANLVEVYINGNLYGLFTNVEAVNKDFLEGFFSTEDNILFKCDGLYGAPPQTGCIGGGGSALAFKGLDSTCYFNNYELKRDYGWNALTHAIDVLNNNSSQAHQVFNIDRALWMLAFNNLLVNFDSYTGSRHNYYIYLDKNDRFHTILWDLNEAFGSFGNAGMGPPMSINAMKNLDPLHNINSFNHPLIQKLLAVDSYRKSYMAHLRTIFNEHFNNGSYSVRLNQLKLIADAAVQADLNKIFSYQDFLNNYNNNVTNIPGLNDFIAGRVSYLSGNIDMNYSAPIISLPTLSNNNPIANDTVWIRTTVSNASSVKLRYRWANHDLFMEKDLLDDASMQDSLAADGIYGGFLVLPATGVQYYIYAENMDAAMFSPERAAYEYYHINSSAGLIPSSVVINELCAANNQVMADQDGEFDDWVELYNNTGSPINLSGLYLSDDINNTNKWAFPDTTIAANDYLIVWVDDDPSQAGLHCDFKLSSSGEEFAIFDNAGNIIDSVSFGQQSSDITYGRFPNGTGPYILMSPTFAAQNVENNQIQTIGTNHHNWNVYPNPVDVVGLKLVIHSPKMADFNCLVHNSLGQLIWANQFEFSAVNRPLLIPTNRWSPGVFTISIIDQFGRSSRQIIKK